jgi:anti-sigma-K factor RskA
MLAAAVALVIAFGGDDAKTPQPVPQVAATLVLKPVGGGPATAKLTVSGNRAEIVGSELPPTPEGKHYEAWLARNDGAMKPMGGFTVDDSGKVKVGMEFYEDLSEWEYVDVSIEPDGSPPSHSGNSVLRAQL